VNLAMAVVIVQIAMLLALPPFIIGLIRKVKARLQCRRGASVLQPYADLAKLFKKQPVVIFLDEAHQFLDKQLGDENTKYPLDSFDLIAKEGRKYGLTICIATQRPRDIPEGVLSQMGTLIVHRLINDRDREVVERASGEIDRSAAEFLPTLAPGQAVIIGVDFPIPLTIQIKKPNAIPDSQGPNYQEHWKNSPHPAVRAERA